MTARRNSRRARVGLWAGTAIATLVASVALAASGSASAHEPALPWHKLSSPQCIDKTGGNDSLWVYAFSTDTEAWYRPHLEMWDGYRWVSLRETTDQGWIRTDVPIYYPHDAEERSYASWNIFRPTYFRVVAFFAFRVDGGGYVYSGWHATAWCEFPR